MKFSVFQMSRKGGRKKNEDRMGYCYTRGSAIFILADGMGGHPLGDIAAQLTLQAISALFQIEAKPVLPNVSAFLEAAALAAHRDILRYSIEKGMMDTPRTTLVAVVVQDGGASWIHCGDSRLYVVREGGLLARTRDHSFLEQRQRITLATKSQEPLNRNILFTCLGSPAKPVLDVVGPVALLQGDTLMLCSDGLWGSVSDEDIVRELAHRPIGEAVPELVEKALRKAGDTSDNVTAIALEWETPDVFAPTQGSISTATISDGVFASTIEAGWLDSGLEDLDDAAIEQSIAEINEAIRRSAARKS